MMPGMAPVMMPMQQPMAGKGGERRPGDWKCYACGNNNYASRTVCNKPGCGVPKEAFIAKSGLRAGDWLCPACANHNFSGKTNCKMCGAPRGNAKINTTGMKEGDWLCPSCSNHNY